MGLLTVVDAFGQTLEQALEQALGDRGATRALARAGDPAVGRTVCLVCGGRTVAIPLHGARTFVSCRDCHSTIETAEPAQRALRLAS